MRGLTAENLRRHEQEEQREAEWREAVSSRWNKSESMEWNPFDSVKKDTRRKGSKDSHGEEEAPRKERGFEVL